MTIASEAAYQNSIKNLFPQGDYWDEQFKDSEGDCNLFVRGKTPELLRFLQRKKKLKEESIIETTDELIADWERVYLGHTTSGLTLEERRAQVTANRILKLNRVQLQNIADIYSLTINDIYFPFRAGFFGFSRFGIERIGDYYAFNVLFFKVLQTDFKQNCWAVIQEEYLSRNRCFGFIRFGIDRLAYFPIHKLYDLIEGAFRRCCTGFIRFGIDRLLPIDTAQLQSVVNEKLSDKGFGRMRFALDRLVEYDGGFSKKLAADVQGLFDDFINEVLIDFDFYTKFEDVLCEYYIRDKKPFKEFEEAITAKLLANQIPFFKYIGE